MKTVENVEKQWKTDENSGKRATWMGTRKPGWGTPGWGTVIPRSVGILIGDGETGMGIRTPRWRGHAMRGQDEDGDTRMETGTP